MAGANLRVELTQKKLRRGQSGKEHQLEKRHEKQPSRGRREMKIGSGGVRGCRGGRWRRVVKGGGRKRENCKIGEAVGEDGRRGGGGEKGGRK